MFEIFRICIKNNKFAFALVPIFVALEVFMEILLPVLMSKIINVGIAENLTQYNLTFNVGNFNWHWFTLQNRMDYILAVGAIMVVMTIFALIFGVLAGRFSSIAATGFGKSLRGEVFDKIQKFSFLNIDKFSTSSLVTRTTTDINNIQNAFFMVNRIIIRAPFMLILALAFAITINAQLSLIFVLAIPVLVVGIAIIGAIAFPRFTKMLKIYDKLNEKTQENLIGIRVVKSFVREKDEIEDFKKLSTRVQKLQVKAEKLTAYTMPLLFLVSYLCVVAILWFGGNKIITGSMEIGSIIAFINYVMQILISLMMMGFLFVMYIISKASIKRVKEIYNEKVDIVNPEIENVKKAEDGSILFENVDFSYLKDKSKLHLQNVNFKIESGETIGIIGGTGSAKSTLVQLIPRLYDVTNGSIKVGGFDVREQKIEELRKDVGMVLQKNVLFSGTIEENLKWGNENATLEQMQLACETAQASEFIDEFSEGYQTMLEQGGSNLSGGQKQRLCIARALLKNPKILILDDSTSAVDTATDKKIRESFKNGFADTTLIVISQRVTSVADADRIIVMDDGKICDIGTHNELLETSIIYKEVYDIQKKGVA